MVLLDKKVDLQEKAEREEYSISSMIYSPNKLELEVDTKKSGIFVLTDSWYPGWKAFIDRAQTQILKANYTYRALIIPEGTHKIQFIYSPESFRMGVMLSVGTLSFLSIIVLVGVCYGRKK